MRTLTHVPLAMAGVLLILVAVVAVLSVVVPTVIKSRRSRNARPAEAGTESVASALGATGPGAASMRRVAPGPALAALTPDSPVLPVDLTSEWWRANPTEPLGLSELVRWNDITEKYEWVAVPVVVPGRES